MRRMGFGTVAAAIGAAASSLLSSTAACTRPGAAPVPCYGFDYDSYVWRGYGVFTQLVAMHLSFVTLALLHGVMTRGRGYVAAIVALSALVLSHVLYAYMMAISAGVVAVAGPWRASPPRRLRLAARGLSAGLLVSDVRVPVVTSS